MSPLKLAPLLSLVLISSAIAQESPTPIRVIPGTNGYTVYYDTGDVLQIRPCGQGLCFNGSKPGLPPPPALPLTQQQDLDRRQLQQDLEDNQ